MRVGSFSPFLLSSISGNLFTKKKKKIQTHNLSITTHPSSISSFNLASSVSPLSEFIKLTNFWAPGFSWAFCFSFSSFASSSSHLLRRSRMIWGIRNKIKSQMEQLPLSKNYEWKSIPTYKVVKNLNLRSKLRKSNFKRPKIQILFAVLMKKFK
jgi:hypothetical protein